MGHGGAAGSHTILQVVGDNRGDIIRSDGNGLYKRRGVSQIIISDPGTDDGAAGTELSVIGLCQRDGEVGIVIVTVVRCFYIGRWGDIGGT